MAAASGCSTDLKVSQSCDTEADCFTDEICGPDNTCVGVEEADGAGAGAGAGGVSGEGEGEAADPGAGGEGEAGFGGEGEGEPADPGVDVGEGEGEGAPGGEGEGELAEVGEGEGEVEGAGEGEGEPQVPEDPYVQVVAGGAHGCARRATGAVVCWGQNTVGEVGDGTNRPRHRPVAVEGVFDDIVTTRLATLARAGGRVVGWGMNFQGELANGTNLPSHSPTRVGDMVAVSSLAGGRQHACAVDGGVAKCWGWNTNGQIGSEAPLSRRVATPVEGIDLDDGDTMIGVAAGGFHSCAFSEMGAVWCWGNDNRGQLGDGEAGPPRHVAQRVQGLPPLEGEATVAMAASDATTCALLRSGRVLCWGYNGQGQAGVGVAGELDELVPAPAALGGARAEVLTAGFNHFCVALDDGGARCWGRNTLGQLGDGTTTDRARPTPVDRLGWASSVSASASQTCAALRSGEGWCWGDNRLGQQGDAVSRSIPSPMPVPGMEGATILGLTERHVCAAAGDETQVSCWGANDGGVIGDIGAFASASPVAIEGIAGVLDVGSSHGDACVLLADRRVKCWGPNTGGLRGTGVVNGPPAPGPAVDDLANVNQLAVGHYLACASLSGGSVRCWGSGQLTPAVVDGVDGVVDVMGGAGVQCVVFAGGGAACWGATHLGDGTSNTSAVPVPMDLPDDFHAVQATHNGYHGCVRSDDGRVRCWGDNSVGQLGDGSTTLRRSPALVDGLPGPATRVVAGASHTCAQIEGGGAVCWGDNRFGQLGDGSVEDSLRPQPVLGPDLAPLDDVDRLVAGRFVTCVIRTDLGAWCWGSNDYGAVGNGAASVERHVPAFVQGLDP